MARIDFQAKWAGMGWFQKAAILRERAMAFICIAQIDKLSEIVEKHKKQHKSVTPWKTELQKYVKTLAAHESTLQRLWGLKEDPNYHTYWMMPKQCTCPKMDNWDRLGFGRIISEDCPLHGKGALKGSV